MVASASRSSREVNGGANMLLCHLRINSTARLASPKMDISLSSVLWGDVRSFVVGALLTTKSFHWQADPIWADDSRN